VRQRKASAFYVAPWLDLVGELVERHRDFWLALGRLETSMVAAELRDICVRTPIYISGLARSGSTLLHEIIAGHPQVATHRIKDYPLLFTPYWWRRATANLPQQAARERAHHDRVQITVDSPDALDEVLWMAFFPRLHEPAVSNLLGPMERNPAFESFYSAHIRKLLLSERKLRYTAKNNYLVARLPYVLRIFPDARVLIPVRAPAGHIASLLRQQRHFAAGQRNNRPALRYMQRTGHFEFGRDRRPLNLGDSARTGAIQHAWAAGDEVRGLAMYWDMVHGYLARLLAADAVVGAAALVVRFETLCGAPEETLKAVLTHCALPEARTLIERQADRIRYPSYYANPFTAAELAVIRAETAETAALWGYQE
jgi:hypothetical protein